jgi:hypothetical protein
VLRLEAALEFIIPTSAAKLKKIAKLMGENTDGLSDIEGAYLAKQAVVELMKDIDFPSCKKSTKIDPPGPLKLSHPSSGFLI